MSAAICSCTSCASPTSPTTTPSSSFSAHGTITMPSSTMDWRSSPNHVLHKMLVDSNCNDNWEAKADEFFRARLTDSVVAELPDVESVDTQDMVDGQMVKFRGMLQDLFDPEYFLSSFTVKDLSTGKTRVDTCKYRDIAPIGPREEMVEGSEKTSERQAFYTVSVPAEAPWVKEGFKKKAATSPIPSGSGTVENKLKRSMDEENGKNNVEMMEDDSNGNNAVVGEAVKKARTDEHGASVATQQSSQKQQGAQGSVGINLPIAGSKGKATIVKIYTTEDTFALNECYEFVGIVSLDPSLAMFPTDGTEMDIMAQFGEQERMAKSPPPSLVPRIHVLRYTKLNHSNPLLPVELPKSMGNASEAAACRSELHALLTKVLLGDALAADYLLCHLVARIYLRRDELTLGKFSLNLFNVPATEQYTRKLSTVLQLLIEKSHFLPMSVDTFNKNKFVPVKDYHANRLVSGMLQLAEGTHLLLDETAMANGELTPEGLKNLTSVGTLINWQKLEYDFRYHQLEFKKDVPCLIMSEGRSMLPNDSQIMLKPVEGSNDVTTAFSGVGPALNAQVLDKIRKFITVARNLPFEVSDSVQEAVQDDFVKERQGGNVGMATAEDLHRHLVLARLVALSHGLEGLTSECWARTKEMEKERRERMAHLAERPRPNGPLAGQMA